MIAIPDLPHGCGSWVVSRLTDRSVIGEFFERSNVEKFSEKTCFVETALDYLQRINKEIQMKHVSFVVSKEDKELIGKVVERVKKYVAERDLAYDIMDCEMDLTATHANGCPLDFPKLLAFDDFNFSHDVFGIRRHLDRATGKLGGFFLPRCVKKTRTLREIALEVRRDWTKPYFGAVPYLDAMLSLGSIDEDYGADSAKDVVIYFLSNATKWRGETARRVKAELKQIAGLK